MKKRILFVCKQNVFRSALAEKILRKIKRGKYSINSAALRGGYKRVPEIIIRAGKKFGIDMRRHKPKRLNKKLVKWSDIIFVFERVHRREIIKMYPESSGKVILVTEFADMGNNDIKGQKGKPFKEHLKAIKELHLILRKVAKRL